MAASSTAVTVLTPNGRRQTVKVSPNTPLLQVLEEVCKKHGFNPDDHGLKFQRNVLDLTLQWRFASLPNNAKLEMVPSTRKQAVADSQVRIALQMEDGSRMQGSFSCSQNLWELLTHFPQTRVSELSECGSTPVCVYMRDEVSGEEALKKTTLKSLGLTAGSAIVRFLLKKNRTAGEENGREAMEITATPTTPVAKECPPTPAAPVDAAPSQAETAAAEVPIKPSSPDPPVENQPALTLDSVASLAPSTLPVQQEVGPNPQGAVQPKAKPSGGGMPEEDGERAGPSGLNFINSSSSSESLSVPFIPFSGGGQRLGGQGQGGAGLLSSSFSSVSAMAAVGSPKAKKAKSSHGSNVKGQVASSQEDEDFNLREEFLEPVEREPLIFHMDSEARHHGEHQELPDEFFEVTVDDIRKRFAQLKSERRKLEETPLMTKALREAQMKEKIDRYPKVVLRIQFPDRHVLQGFFRPLETVADVRHFVKSHLAESVLSFYLFIAPPKTILDDPSATLFQANLFPGALLYFGSDIKTDYYLQGELVNFRVSASQANESVASSMPRSPASCPSSVGPKCPPPPPELSKEECETRGEEQELSVPPQASQPTRPDPGKVPKWLKLPGKK